MKVHAFLPRSESKIVFVVVLACYSIAVGVTMRTVTRAFGVPEPEPGLLLERGSGTAHAVVLLFLAPIVESLLLIGTIELSRKLRAPFWLQVACSTAFIAILHSEAANPWGVAVVPGFAIQSLAYLYWRPVSWKIGYAVVASIHALYNVLPAINALSYAARNT